MINKIVNQSISNNILKQKGTINTIYKREIDMNKTPYISTYYIKPIVEPTEEVTIDYYISDWYGENIISKNFEHTFKVTVRIDGKDDIIIENLKAGDHSVSLGTFPNLDGEEQKFSMLCTDEFGRNSHELFNYFLVRNPITINEYVMATDDLTKYNIKNNDDREIFKLITGDVSSLKGSEKENKILELLATASENTTIPEGKYLVTAFDENNDGIADINYRRHNVKYHESYDKDAVKTESQTTREGLQKLFDDKAAEGYNKIKLLKGIYRVDENKIYIPTNFTLDMNGATFKMNSITGSKALILELNETYDSHVINGTIEGDYFSHDYTNSPDNSEWVNGISISSSSKYSSFENIILKNITGYGSGNGIAKNKAGDWYTIGNSQGLNFENGDIDRDNGNLVESNKRVRSVDFKDISSFTSNYFTVSKILGYQGNVCSTWIFIGYFYDENKSFIKAIDGYQYRRMGIPKNSKYVKIVLLTPDIPDNGYLCINFFKVPVHCSFKNIKHDNCRCVGMATAQMNNMLVEDCEFARCGQNAARCAFDAEDGWDMMQDVTFRRLNFHDNPLNDWLTCAGHNFIIENHVAGSIFAYARSKDIVVRNSNCYNLGIDYDSNIKKHGIARLYNNTIISGSIDKNICRDSICNGNIGISGVYYNTPFRSFSFNHKDSLTAYDSTITFDSEFVGYISKEIKLVNCDIKNGDSYDGLKKISFNSYKLNGAKMTFYNCKFYGKVYLANNTTFRSAKFIDCWFEDVYMDANCECRSLDKIIFKNCEINSSANNFLTYRPFGYTVGTWTYVEFDDCKFNFTSESLNLIYCYTKPAIGKLILNNCIINTVSKFVLVQVDPGSNMKLFKNYEIILNHNTLNNSYTIDTKLNDYIGKTVFINETN